MGFLGLGQPGGGTDPSLTGGSQKDINFVKEAFKVQYNWIALAGMGLFAVVTTSALPLVLAGGLELMYLATISTNSRFQRLVRS